MRFAHSQLVKLMVRTESGTELGRVHEVIYNGEAHAVATYVVTSGMILPKSYEIAPRQVVSISETEMIVEDTITPISNESTVSQSMPAGASPVMITESE